MPIYRVERSPFGYWEVEQYDGPKMVKRVYASRNKTKAIGVMEYLTNQANIAKHGDEAIVSLTALYSPNDYPTK